MTAVAPTLDPAFVSAFRAGTLTAAQVEVALPRDRAAVIFLLLPLSTTLAAPTGTPASSCRSSTAPPMGPAGVGADPPVAPGAVVPGLTPFLVARPGVDGIGLRVDLSDGSTVVLILTPDEPPEPAPPGVTLYELADW